jgi:hypothetical protein
MTGIPDDPAPYGPRVLAPGPPHRPEPDWVGPADRAPSGTPSLMQIAAQNRARLIEERTARAQELLYAGHRRDDRVARPVTRPRAP